MTLILYRFLCTEVYKTLNNLYSSFKKYLFKLREANRSVCEAYKMNSDIPRTNQVMYATKNLKTYGPKISNPLPFHINALENLFNVSENNQELERCLLR